jgi:hypothetical protein
MQKNTKERIFLDKNLRLKQEFLRIVFVFSKEREGKREGILSIKLKFNEKRLRKAFFRVDKRLNIC